MAHYYGTLKGLRGAATRCGTQSSGLETVAASWSGAVRVVLYEGGDGDGASTWARVELTPWRGCGVSRVLYEGPVDGEPLDALGHATHAHELDGRP